MLLNLATVAQVFEVRERLGHCHAPCLVVFQTGAKELLGKLIGVLWLLI